MPDKTEAEQLEADTLNRLKRILYRTPNLPVPSMSVKTLDEALDLAERMLTSDLPKLWTLYYNEEKARKVLEAEKAIIQEYFGVKK